MSIGLQPGPPGGHSYTPINREESIPSFVTLQTRIFCVDSFKYRMSSFETLSEEEAAEFWRLSGVYWREARRCQ